MIFFFYFLFPGEYNKKGRKKKKDIVKEVKQQKQ